MKYLITLVIMLFSFSVFSQGQVYVDRYSESNTNNFTIRERYNINTDPSKTNKVTSKLLSNYSNLKITGNYMIFGGAALATSSFLINDYNKYNNYNFKDIKKSLVYVGAGIATVGCILHIIAPYKMKKLSKYYNGNTIIIPLN